MSDLASHQKAVEALQRSNASIVSKTPFGPVTALSGPHSEPECAEPQDTPMGSLDYCPMCDGEGYLIDSSGPGTYDLFQEVWLPTDVCYPCDACRGTGLARLYEEPSLRNATHEHVQSPPTTTLPLYTDEPDLPF